MAARQSFRPPPAAGPEPPAPPPPSGKSLLKRLLPAGRNLVFFAVGLAAALAAVLLYRAVRPPAAGLTHREVEAAVEKALEEQARRPTVTALAYEKVRPSLVLVRAERPRAPGGSAAPAHPGAAPAVPEEPEFALGSGVVVEDTGAILTCLHVVSGAEKVYVVFHDGFESEAAVTVVQPGNDLAVLQAVVVPEGLVPATMAGSAHLMVGDPVVAVGNPFGIPNSVTAGVVSGLGRSFTAPQTGVTLSNLIQFDAAVNPGNSGGPLLDRNGDVVGIVTALLNPVEQEFFVGIGFAVTAETAAAAFGIPPW